MDTNSVVVCIKTDDIYKDIAKDVGTGFDTLSYELNKPLPKGKDKKVIVVIKDDLGGKNMNEFVGLRAKTYSYLIDDGSEDKNAKSAKLKFEDYEKYLEATQLEKKINHLEKNDIDVDSL